MTKRKIKKKQNPFIIILGSSVQRTEHLEEKGIFISSWISEYEFAKIPHLHPIMPSVVRGLLPTWLSGGKQLCIFHLRPDWTGIKYLSIVPLFYDASRPPPMASRVLPIFTNWAQSKQTDEYIKLPPCAVGGVASSAHLDGLGMNIECGPRLRIGLQINNP